ncbi:PEP-CTERM sorting domain-containing protein [Fuerstiella marisgermanici]|nr:PEP-CTERM sorting domain-containing protein [Fuerstiella marisgermanici]
MLGSEATVAGIAPDGGIAALDLRRGTGLGSTGAADSFNSNGWDSPPPISPSAADEYFSFGFTVDGATSVVLSDLTISTRSSDTGPGTLGLYSNLDNFTASLHTFTQSGTTPLDPIIDLSSLGTLTNQTVEFRLIEIGNTQADGTGTTSGGGTFRVTNFERSASQPITFSGTISAVPEPSTLLGCLISGLILASVRCRSPRRNLQAE